MIRTALMKTLMWVIVPIAFTFIFYVTVDYKEGAHWISLIFVWLAYITASVSYALSIGNRYEILNYTLALCAIGYFIIEIIVAIAFLYIYTNIPQWSFTAQLLIFVAYILLWGYAYITNHKTNRQMQELKKDRNLVNQWKAKAVLMQLNSPSNKTKELLDLISITPVKSNKVVAALDKEISSLIKEPSSIDVVISKIRERNSLLKSLNS